MANYELNQIALGLTAVAATTAIYYSNKTKRTTPSLKILVFPDGGEKCSTTGGLEPNAITIRLRVELEKLEFLKNTITNELGGEYGKIRLFVQATKKEIKDDQDLKSILLSKGIEHGLTAVVLVSTQNIDLSPEAISSKPLRHFSPPSNVRDLTCIGLGHKLAYNGEHRLPLRNAADNLFQHEQEKTVLIKRPPYTDDSFYENYNIDYHPSMEYGLVDTVDPRMIEEMMKRQEDFPKMFTSKVERAIQEYGGPGLFTSSTTDDSWKTGHGVLPRFFNAFRMKNYYPIILDKTESFIKEWTKLGKNSHVEDVNDWLTCMTADAVVKASMDYDMRNVERKGSKQELHKFIRSFRYCCSHVIGTTSPRDQNKYLKEKKVSEDMVSEIVEQTRKGEIGGPLSFITGMLKNKSSTNQELVALGDFYGHCINLMVAGHETTAATLGFCLAEMARNPDVMARAVTEIENVLGDRASPDYEDISKLKYIDACFKETLRLNPPVQNFKRECANDTIVLDNHLLRKGQRIELLLGGMYRDPDQWDQGVFGDVEKFNPDRHLPGAPPRHPNAMAPFGFGVRGCIGMQFALLEAKTFLCMVLNFFKVQTPDGYVPIPSMGDGLAPTCLNLSLNLSFRAGGPLSRVKLFDDDITGRKLINNNVDKCLEKNTRTTAAA